MTDYMTLSPALYLKMIQDCQRDLYKNTSIADILRPKPATMYGVPLHENPLFPFETNCSDCGGTGEGKASTYCPRCKGAGASRTLGMMQNGAQTILIQDTLPKKFAPSFPIGLVAMPPMCRGLA